jgi:OOP family OmpA-OmpF porin
MLMKQIILVFFLILGYQTLYCHNDSLSSRVLLPYSINSYQPTLLPVLTIDGSKMYLDRKWHPFNLGEGLDSDDIWLSSKLQGDFWSEPVNLEVLNTKNPDMLFSITPDNASALLYGSFIDNDEGFYFADRTMGNWRVKKRLKIINYYNNWDQYGASISFDKKVLLLALNREDTRGGLDLYVSFFNPSGNFWSAPQSIGNTINTTGIEAAPFLAYDNKTLYFASNGHDGYGKLDLFKSIRLDDSWNSWSKPVNMGQLFNTAEDENSIWLTALADTAYIVSYDTLNNRSAIFSVTIPDSLKPEPYYILNGNVYFIDQREEPYEISIEEIGGDILNAFTLSDSKYYAVLPTNGNYRITAKAASHEDYSFLIRTNNPQKPEYLERDIVFRPVTKPAILTKTIYFDFNSPDLTEEAKKEITQFIKSIPYDDYKVELTGHADESGSDDYNTQLSYKRAKNTGYFLENMSIMKDYIIVKWEGEQKPISTDQNKNRRVEIVVVSE